MRRRAPAPLSAAILLVAVLAAVALGRSYPRHAAAPEPEAPGAPATPLATGGALDVNTASAADLSLLPRIGPTLARRIVEERDARGPYGSLEELASRVRGVGPRTVEGLRGLAEARAGDASTASELRERP
ncbi:MAG: helix-hairpin-helix domain-containing protein [Sandaracinaceae bacterium]|nr:helix-hairpin-helix domain-containing protein [Sandaracinaceae bacterium]